ncbi:ATP-binding protein [Pedobacter sp.]|uniref:sensor histidine kinase n=1 Tax=Pedobacter sp. TaxID=1411316 RepID=UPI00396CEE46
MKIKAKLTIGVGLLFILIVLLAVVSTKYVNSLKKDTENILRANYNTLEYARNMLIALDEMGTADMALYKFETNLLKQQHNITEEGEKAATQKIKQHFQQLRIKPVDPKVHVEIRRDITELMRLNMAAIERKSDVAKQTASSAIIWISVTGMLCFLIAFILLVNLPGNIANPIKELTTSIRQIAAQNYHQRVHFEGHSEFGELARSFNTMAKKLEEYANSKIEHILKDKKRIETLINNMHDPVIGIDENQKVLFANQQALKITGLKTEQLIGKQIEEVALNNDLVRELTKHVNHTDRAGKETIKIFADDKESYFEKEQIDISIIPTGEHSPQHIGQVILLRNVTTFKELDFAKTNFIATVSHELKTPISSIRMSLQLLSNKQVGELNEEQQGLLHNIQDDTERLLNITGELLNMSQVETGNIQLNKQAGDPLKMVQYALEATKAQVEQKHVGIISEISENLPEIYVDIEKTAWVLINFITNAVRYSSEEGKIIVSVVLEANRLIFSVEDFGPGIENRYTEKIFDRYFQIPGSNKTGTGLGLAISKDFIETQGGIIGVQSKPGYGSKFYFSFPLAS